MFYWERGDYANLGNKKKNSKYKKTPKRANTSSDKNMQVVHPRVPRATQF